MQRDRQLLLMVKRKPILDTQGLQKRTKHSIMNITAQVMAVLLYSSATVSTVSRMPISEGNKADRKGSDVAQSEPSGGLENPQPDMSAPNNNLLYVLFTYVCAVHQRLSIMQLLLYFAE